jgi:hypothetical protein
VKLASLDVVKTQAARDAFERIWTKWPTTRPDGARAKGHKVEAERAFQRILDARKATVEELEEAVDFYLTKHPNVAKGFVVMVATFFGGRKGIWLETVRILREQPLREVRA